MIAHLSPTEGGVMATGMLIKLPGGTQEFYDSVMEHLDWDNQPKPAGYISHTAGASPTGWVVFDVWEPQQDFENFMAPRLGAALNAASGGEAPRVGPPSIQYHRQGHAPRR